MLGNLGKFLASTKICVKFVKFVYRYCVTMHDLNNKMSVPKMEFFQIKIFVSFDKTNKIFKIV